MDTVEKRTAMITVSVYRLEGVLRTFQCCQWKSQLLSHRPIARWPCTKKWKWPSTSWTRL